MSSHPLTYYSALNDLPVMVEISSDNILCCLSVMSIAIQFVTTKINNELFQYRVDRVSLLRNSLDTVKCPTKPSQQSSPK